MISEIFSDLFGSMGYVFDTASPVHLVMILAIALFAGIRMSSFTAIFGWVFEASLILAGLSYLWNWLSADNRFSFDVWEYQTVQSWNQLMAFSVEQVLGYFTLFFLAILGIFLVKSFARG